MYEMLAMEDQQSNVKLILESIAFNVSIKSLYCLEYLILSQFIKVSEEGHSELISFSK